MDNPRITRKLALFGHVHNYPERKITSYYSWPKLIDYFTVRELIQSFSRAFTLISVDIEYRHA